MSGKYIGEDEESDVLLNGWWRHGDHQCGVAQSIDEVLEASIAWLKEYGAGMVTWVGNHVREF